MSRRRTSRVAVLVLVTAAVLTGCGGKDTDSSGAKGPDPRVEYRYPRYWATVDQAESGAEGASNARFFVGVDGDRIVYNAEDVIRVIDRNTGKQITRTLLPRGEVVCTVPPDHKIDHHVLVVGTGKNGTEGNSDCSHIRAYDVQQGRFLWSADYKIPVVLSLDSRDDSVMASSRAQSPEDSHFSYDLTVLDLESGKKRWNVDGLEAFTDQPSADLEDCFVAGAIAAAKPIVVTTSKCDDFGNDNASPGRVTGFELDSGKVLWRQDVDFLEPDEDFGIDDSIKPHPADGAFIPGDHIHEAKAAYLDLRTGKGHRVAEPTSTFDDGSKRDYDVDTEFGALGNGFYDQYVLPVGGRLLYVDAPSTDSKLAFRVVAVSAKTGKRAWVRTLTKNKATKKNQYVDDYEFLGVDDSHTQFWVALDKEHLARFSIEDGKQIGKALLGPPLGLTKITAIGPNYFAVRTQGGISGGKRDVPSGLDYYRTNVQ